MATILNTYKAAGYTFGTGVTELIITSTGGVGGTGVVGNSVADTIQNSGKVNASDAGDSGVSLTAGGTVTNGTNTDTTALLQGAGNGIAFSNAAGTVANFGTIAGLGDTSSYAGVRLNDGGALTNGGVTDQVARIEGYNGVVAVGASATVANFGTIAGQGPGFAGIDLTAGGSVTNGAVGDFSALISGAYAVYVKGGSGTVVNFGTIEASVGEAVYLKAGGSMTNGSPGDHAASAISPKGIASAVLATMVNFGTVVASNGDAINLIAAGTVTNGANTDSSALLQGAGNGVAVEGAAGTVANFGTIDGIGNAGAFAGVLLNAGGGVTNGGLTDQVARIEGYNGVLASGGSASVANFGTIAGDGAADWAGVSLEAGGSVTNGAVGDLSALISGAFGVYLKVSGTVANYGTIQASVVEAVYLKAGGLVTNGSASDTAALMSGADGLHVGGAPGSVTNFGTIAGSGGAINNYGVGFTDGGQVTNGASLDEKALVQGYDGVTISGAAGTVVNFATIHGEGASNAAGVVLASGVVTNGGTTDSSALIEGAFGVFISGGASSVVNYGTIRGAGHAGVRLVDGGAVTNGAAEAPTALIGGSYAIFVSGAAGTVTNFGTLQASSNQAYCVEILDSGSIVNGSTGDTAALISGGVVMSGSAELVTNRGTIQGALGAGVALSGTVDNYGAHALIEGRIGVSDFGAGAAVVNQGLIEGRTGGGVYLNGGGSVTNGAGGMTGAMITGTYGALVLAGAGTVNNLGTVAGVATGAGGFGVELASGGNVVNGALTDRAALISGDNGITLTLAGSVTNFGTINGLAGYGVVGQGGGTVTNGSVADTTALIEGAGGVNDAASGTVTNFATVLGDGYQDAVSLGAGGAITNGSAKDSKAVIEGYAGVYTTGAATVTNFATIDGIGGTAVQFNSASDVLVVEAGSTFIGAVNGDGGTLDLASGTGTVTLLAGDNVVVLGSMATTTFSNFGTVEVGTGASFTLSGNGAVPAGQTLVDDGTLVVPGALTVPGTITVAGTLSGAGTVAISGGTANLNAGTSLSVADVTVSGAAKVNVNTSLTYAGKWTQSAGTLATATGDVLTFDGAGDSFAGTFATTGEVVVSGVTATVGSAGLSLTGTGYVLMSDSAASEITGATAGSTLTVSGRLYGAGKLGAGQMTLALQSAGVIASVGTNALTIDTGTNTIANAGIIEAVGAGGATIVSAVANTGRLLAYSSLLTVEGVVSGSGYGQVDTGTLKIASTATFNQNVIFSGTGGTLELAHGLTYGGTITGFSATSGTFLVLDDVKFVSAGEATWNSGTGILTVNGGTGDIASIHLSGSYGGSTFTCSADGAGVKITDPPKPPVASAPHVPSAALIHAAFIQAMASLAHDPAMHADPWTHDHRFTPTMLVAPRISSA